MIIEPQAPPPVVSEADNGSAVRLRRGATVNIVLQERPTTGYRWRMVRAPLCCQIRQDEFEAPAPGAPPGAPGRHTWRLEATDTGAGPVELQLRPTPGRSGATAQVFTVNFEAID